MLNILFQKLAFPQDLFRLDYISLRKCSVTFYSGLSGLLLGLILTVWGIYLFCGWDFFPWCVLTGHWPLYTYYFVYSLVQLLSRVQLFVTPWTAARKASLSITNSQLPESTQTHVHRVSDAIQPSHPLSSPSPPTFNLSQHQALFKWVSSLHQVAKVLEFQLQHQSSQRTPRTDLL